jgi:predicted glutamine amidotransferase
MLKRKPGLGKPSGSTKRAILFSTKNFTNENWVKIPKDRLLVANNGEVITLSDPI